MLLWKGGFPSVPSLIVLELDGAPHQDGPPGTSVCHQMIFHPKLCCFHSWSCKGRSRERGSKATQPLPLPSGALRLPCPGRGQGGRRSLSRDEGPDFPPCGKGIQRPSPQIPPETTISGVSSLGSGAWPAGVPVACLRESRTTQISPIGQFLFHAVSPAKANRTLTQ